MSVPLSLSVVMLPPLVASLPISVIGRQSLGKAVGGDPPFATCRSDYVAVQSSESLLLNKELSVQILIQR